jgi:hypothetical protein
MGGKDRVTLLGRERAVEVVLHAEGHEPDLGPLVLRNLPRRAHGHLARDGREPAIRLLDGLTRPRWTLLDAPWTPTSRHGDEPGTWNRLRRRE